MAESTHNGSVSDYRIIKKMSPKARGATTLARRFGDSVVCARYRTDQAGKYRFTTVELLVNVSAIRHTGDVIVAVKTELFEVTLRSSLLASGAVWDSEKKLWYLPRRVAIELDLKDRIVRERR